MSKINVDKLVTGQKYWVVGGPGYNRVEFIRTIPPPVSETPPGQPASETPVTFLQLAFLGPDEKPLQVLKFHPEQGMFFETELEACSMAAAVALSIFKGLTERAGDLSRLDRPIILPNGAGIGPAPNRLLIKP